jgi:glucans biosynthesis protein C
MSDGQALPIDTSTAVGAPVRYDQGMNLAGSGRAARHSKSQESTMNDMVGDRAPAQESTMNDTVGDRAPALESTMNDTVGHSAPALGSNVHESIRTWLTNESLRVQTLRGVACLLLVSFHVIGSHATSGLRVDADSIYRQFSNLFIHLRMPLFTFLSGFVYAYRPATRAYAGTFAGKKLRRLLLPLLCVSTLYFLLTFVVPDSTGRLPLQQMWRIYLFPYVHFWFLQAIILVFAVVVVLESLQLLANIRRYAIVLAMALALHLCVGQLNDATSLFSAVHAAYLVPFFLLGLGANRFRAVLLRPLCVWISFICFLGAMTIHSITVAAHGQIAEPGTVLGLIIGVSGTLTLIHIVPRCRPLELLGAYSFTIYLFHPFFVAAARSILKLTQVTSTELGFVLGMAAGLLGPPVLERALRGMALPRQMLLGQR